MGNVIDGIVSFFNPVAGLRRASARSGLSAVRNYDIASKGRRTQSWWRPFTNASQEVSKAEPLAAASAQELVRNNPSAKRIKRVLAARTVGAGIRAEIINRKKRSKTALSKLEQRWEDWVESTECDFEGHHTFYGLQWLWMGTIVESGGVFIRKHVKAGLACPLQLQTFEQSHLDRTKKPSGEGVEVIDGVQFKDGQIEGYWLYSRPTDTVTDKSSRDSDFYSVTDVVHIYLKERAGQHLGITWFDTTAGALRQYDIYEDAKLMQQQIAALFALFVEDGQSVLTTKPGTEGTHELPDELEPGLIQNLNQGQKVTTVTPPKANDSTEFDNGLKQRIASGPGITYAQMTGDYSQFNFASGRMANVEFYAQLEIFQRHMLVPAFNKIFTWFLQLDSMANTVNNTNYKVDWTFPPQASVEPGAEFDLLIKKVRNGMLSPRKAAKALGENLEKLIEQWKEDKELFGDMPFDSDPAMFSSAGNQLDVGTAAAAGAGASTPKDSATEKEKEADNA